MGKIKLQNRARKFTGFNGILKQANSGAVCPSIIEAWVSVHQRRKNDME